MENTKFQGTRKFFSIAAYVLMMVMSLILLSVICGMAFGPIYGGLVYGGLYCFLNIQKQWLLNYEEMLKYYSDKFGDAVGNLFAGIASFFSGSKSASAAA